MSALAIVAVVVVIAAPWQSGTSSQTITGSGHIVSDVRTLPAFSAVELAGTNQVTVHLGAPQRVVVRGDDNIVPHITTQVRGGQLVVDETGSFKTSGTLAVDVTAPALVNVALSGDGSLAVDGVSAERFAARLDGTGVLRVSGTTDWLRARLGGTGALELRNLRATHAAAVLTGDGRIAVFASRSLRASVTGAGSIVYFGNPAVVSRTVTGTGAVSAGAGSG